MDLAGGLDAIEEAQFQQAVTFREGDVSGDADWASTPHRPAGSTLRPGRVPSRYPRVTSGTVTVDARGVHRGRPDQPGSPRPGRCQDGQHGRGWAAAHPRRDCSTGARPCSGSERSSGTQAEAGRARYRGTDAAAASVKQGDTEVGAQTISLVEKTPGPDGQRARGRDIRRRRWPDRRPRSRRGTAPRATRWNTWTRHGRRPTRGARDVARAGRRHEGPDDGDDAGGRGRGRSSGSTHGPTCEATLTQGRAGDRRFPLVPAALDRYTLRGPPVVTCARRATRPERAPSATGR